jgi:hypothetical protein
MDEVFTEAFWLVTVVKLIALFLGAFIVYLAYTGFKRNRSRPLLYVALGFALVTAGTILERVLFLVTKTLLPSTGVGTFVTIIGFIAIIYSIYSVE